MFVQTKFSFLVLLFGIGLFDRTIIVQSVSIYHPNGRTANLETTNEKSIQSNEIVKLGNNDSDQQDRTIELEYRRQFVVDMAKEAWNSYVEYAWPQYNLQPLSLIRQKAALGYSGETIVRSMSTLWLMDLQTEFEQARKWIEKEMIIGDQSMSKIGSLLSCFALTGDSLFRNKAQDIAELSSPTDLSGKGGGYVHKTLLLNEWLKQRLEYPYLSSITNQSKYLKRVQDMDYIFDKQDILNDEVSEKTNWITKVKAFIQSRGSQPNERKQYYDFIDSMERSGNLRRTRSGLWYMREQLPMNYMTSSHCNIGAMLALGQIDKLNVRVVDAWRENIQELKRTVKHLDMAKQITELCHMSTLSSASGLPPKLFFVSENERNSSNEVFLWRDQDSDSQSYWLDPQLAESYFVLWRLTHEEKYRDYAWELALAIHKNCRTKTGYASVRDVSKLPTTKLDNQPPHFLSSTLKYLFLTFSSDQILPLDKWVFNGDGQPLPTYDGPNSEIKLN